ncbi:hypothetical protein EPN54_02710 [bacterium]|nr:MAG: hypothetical protein EPN54_02710 [bacterium]
MKKDIIIFFVLSLLVAGFGFSRVFAAENNPEAGAITQEFSRKAMNEFRLAEHPELDQAVISSKIDEYAQKFTGILLGAGVDPKTAGMIMRQASAWYGQSLEDLFNAKSYNAVIQEYSNKIAGLFNQQHLTMDTQSKIIDMTSDSLESFNDLFHPMEEIDD